VPNSVIINSQVINYTQAGFFEVPIEVRLSKTYDLAHVTQLIIDVAEKEKDILPNPHVEDNKDLQHLFEVVTLKMKATKADMHVFLTRVLVSRIDGDDLVLSIRIWIMDPQHKDDIVSSFLKNLMKQCELNHISFSAA